MRIKRQDFQPLHIDLTTLYLTATEKKGKAQSASRANENVYVLQQDIVKKRILDFIVKKESEERKLVLGAIKNPEKRFKNSKLSKVGHVKSYFISPTQNKEICNLLSVPTDYFIRNIEEEERLEHIFKGIHTNLPFPKKVNNSNDNIDDIIRERLSLFLQTAYGQKIWEGSEDKVPDSLYTLVKTMKDAPQCASFFDEGTDIDSAYQRLVAYLNGYTDRFGRFVQTDYLKDIHWNRVCSFFGLPADYFFSDWHYEMQLKIAIGEIE